MGNGCLNFVVHADHFRLGKKMDIEVVSFFLYLFGVPEVYQLCFACAMTLEHMIWPRQTSSCMDHLHNLVCNR